MRNLIARSVSEVHVLTYHTLAHSLCTIYTYLGVQYVAVTVQAMEAMEMESNLLHTMTFLDIK